MRVLDRVALDRKSRLGKSNKFAASYERMQCVRIAYRMCCQRTYIFKMRICYARLLHRCFIMMDVTKDDNLNRQFRDLRQSVVDTQMVPQYLAPEGRRTDSCGRI